MAGTVGQPAWRYLQGQRRIAAEMRALSEQIARGEEKQIGMLQNVDDSLYTWRFGVWVLACCNPPLPNLSNFDDTLQGGRDINQDLQVLSQYCGQNCLVMEISVPEGDRYPSEPFFLRVVSPRCKQYTGHVTVGGSICMDPLTNTGSPGGWRPDYRVESMLRMVFHSMITCDRMIIGTATGPGGISGPLRIDLHGEQGVPVTQEYSRTEAQNAFRRALNHHMRNGW